MDFVEIFDIILDLSITCFFLILVGVELPLVYSDLSILECYNLFSGVELSMRSFFVILSKRTNERFTNYDGVMSDDSLSLSQKIIHLQKVIDDATRRKIHCASLQGGFFEKSFLQSRNVYKETLEETKFSRWWVLFLRKLHKLAL